MKVTKSGSTIRTPCKKCESECHLALAAEAEYRAIKDIARDGIEAAREIAEKRHGGGHHMQNGKRRKVNTYPIARSILAACKRADLSKGVGYPHRGTYYGVALAINPYTGRYQVTYLPLFKEAKR